jgi:hypothetical protein
MRPRVVATVAVLLAAASAWYVGAAVAATGTSVFVSPGGDDANSGLSAGQPVRTLQRAQSIVRGLNQDMSADIAVVLADGYYRLSRPLTLAPADSGTNGHTVIWSAASTTCRTWLT